MIYVCCHQFYDKYPQQIINDPGFIFLNLGPSKHLGLDNVISDTEGKNVHHLNPIINEITGFYYACKNSEDDWIGICHYHRYFSDNEKTKLLSSKDIDELMKEYDIIDVDRCDLESKPYFNYESSLFNSLKHHGSKPYESYYPIMGLLYDSLIRNDPKSIVPFTKMMGSGQMYTKNMFIMRRNLALEYCEWLFRIIRGPAEYINAFPQVVPYTRLLGFFIERFFVVWMHMKHKENPELKIGKVDYIDTSEPEGKPFI